MLQVCITRPIDRHVEIKSKPQDSHVACSKGTFDNIVTDCLSARDSITAGTGSTLNYLLAAFARAAACLRVRPAGLVMALGRDHVEEKDLRDGISNIMGCLA